MVSPKKEKYFSKKLGLPIKKNESKPLFKVKFKSTPKFFGIGRNIQPRKDLTRFVKWPKYIRIQRQRKILSKKLKIPTIISQFTRTLDKNMTEKVFELLFTYQKNRKKIKKFMKSNKTLKKNKLETGKENFFFIKHGVNSVTNLIKKKKVLFVLIANDVNPIELIVWLPTLCKKHDIPFCIIKNKSRLGKLVNRKKTSCIGLRAFPSDDKNFIENIIACFKDNFNQTYDSLKK